MALESLVLATGISMCLGYMFGAAFTMFLFRRDIWNIK